MSSFGKIQKLISVAIFSSIVSFAPLMANANSSINTTLSNSPILLDANQRLEADRLANAMIIMQAISIAVGDKKREEIILATQTNTDTSIEITSDELQIIN